MAVKDKKCFALDCNELIHRRMLMCTKHWHLVPMGQRDQIYITLAALEADGGTGPVRPYLIAITKAKLSVAIREHCSLETVKTLEIEVSGWEKGEE